MLTILSYTVSMLSFLLEKLEIIHCKHNLLLNTSKTKIVIFQRKHCASNDIDFFLNHAYVEIAALFNYLG